MPVNTYSTSGHRHRQRHHRLSLRQRLGRVERNFAPEIKWSDTNPSPGNITNTGFVGQIVQVTQGDGENQRVGMDLKAKSSTVRFTVQQNVTTPTNCYFRMIHFIWRENITVPNVTSILDSTNHLSPLNRYNAPLFTVISDKSYTLASGMSELQIEKWYKKHWFTQEYQNGTDDPTNNQLYFLAISDQPTTATAPLLTYYHRFSYSDA